MDISRSNKARDICIGGAFIYSGRPDPTWKVGEEVTNELMKMWDSLESWKGHLPIAPPLGYHGCFLRCDPDLELHAFGGVVTLKRPERNEFRIDKSKAFEKLLLSTAPNGLLPVNII